MKSTNFPGRATTLSLFVFCPFWSVLEGLHGAPRSVIRLFCDRCQRHQRLSFLLKLVGRADKIGERLRRKFAMPPLP